jgi:hypothetical protein
MGTWIYSESYKFEYANFIHQNVNWETQSDNDILQILISSQKIKYTTDARGVQFIQKSGRVDLKDFIALKDIQLLREFKSKEFNEIDWTERTMSFTSLSAWIASLYPEKFYPIPMKGFDQTIKYLFNSSIGKFPKVGEKYIIDCQSFMQETWDDLRQYPIEDLCLLEWNKFYKENPKLNIPIKTKLSHVDKVWLVQDFHLFVYRQILNLYKPKNTEFKVSEVTDLVVIEGDSILAQHLRYERNSSFIKKVKEQALCENKMLNCQICGFSFIEKYGEIGEGFIEAHHIRPFFEIKEKTITSRDDIALVCSNCHRMLHRGIETLNTEELKQTINKFAQ